MLFYTIQNKFHLNWKLGLSRFGIPNASVSPTKAALTPDNPPRPIPPIWWHFPQKRPKGETMLYIGCLNGSLFKSAPKE